MLAVARIKDVDISIHALREEGDRLHAFCISQHLGFLSTPSARRATGDTPVQPNIPDISIHALREEGDSSAKNNQGAGSISIHALREEGDHGVLSTSPIKYLFLSTPSARRATHGVLSTSPIKYLFLSTPSARRATVL